MDTEGAYIEETHQMRGEYAPNPKKAELAIPTSYILFSPDFNFPPAIVLNPIFSSFGIIYEGDYYHSIGTLYIEQRQRLTCNRCCTRSGNLWAYLRTCDRTDSAPPWNTRPHCNEQVRRFRLNSLVLDCTPTGSRYTGHSYI